MQTESEIVEAWIASVKSKSRGRTRYEGQEPFADECVVDHIARLTAQLAEAEAEEDRLCTSLNEVFDDFGIVVETTYAEALRKYLDSTDNQQLCRETHPHD